MFREMLQVCVGSMLMQVNLAVAFGTAFLSRGVQAGRVLDGGERPRARRQDLARFVRYDHADNITRPVLRRCSNVDSRLCRTPAVPQGQI
jgi:hypothetical protein